MKTRNADAVTFTAKIVLTTFLFALALVPVAQAATNTVTITADSGAGSLRDTIASSASGDTIVFTNTLSGATIVLTSGELVLSNNVTIDASGLPAGIQINGNTNGRVFQVNFGTTVVLDSLTITNGKVVGTSGGGIFNSGTLTVNRCTLAGNTATIVGGGIENDGTLTVNQCTLTGNSCGDAGGAGIDNLNDTSTMTVNQSTLTGNTATNSSGSGGIYNYSGSCTLSNSIVAGNTASTYTNLYGINILTGVNLTNGVPLLAPLGDYGGPTPTTLPLPGSPAIDGCTNGTGFVTDQRGSGFPRVAGSYADIGAVESGDAIPGASVVTVNDDTFNGIGNNEVSLREAVVLSLPNSTITFAPGLAGETILLTNGQITVDKNLTIDASSLAGGITISCNTSNRLFFINPGATNTFTGLTLTGGNTPLGGGAITSQGNLSLNSCTLTNNHAVGDGGAVHTLGPLRLMNCTVAANSGNYGGGLYVYGNTLSVTNSTVSGNTAANAGGGIYESTGGTLIIQNSTLSGNHANDSGGGILNNSGTLTIQNSTLSGNSVVLDGGGIYCHVGAVNLTNAIASANSAASGANISGPYSGASNLVGVSNINLAPLGNYGGPTQTMPPLPGSPAIDAGLDTGNLPATDQRGYPRLSGAHVDIGAVEAQVASAGNPPVLMNSVWSSGGGSGATFQFSFTNSENLDFTALTATNVALPLTNWTILGNAAQVAPGVYQFTDAGGTNDPQRFYRVVSP